MRLQVMPPYFLLRINKQQQKDRQEKIGSIYLHPNEVFMTRNMQMGEIIGIGKEAHEYFPEAEIGDTAIIHHFIEKKEVGFFIDEDETYNYYITTVFDYMELYPKKAAQEKIDGSIPFYAGKGNLCYGIIKKDGEIIPNKDFIFLETEKPVETDLPDLKLESPFKWEDNVNMNIPLTTHSSGLIVPKEWKETRTDTETKMKSIQAEIENISQTKMTPDVKRGIERKEAEIAALSNKINSKRYEPYIIEHINPDTSKQFAYSQRGDALYMLNIACKTKIEIEGKEYIVAQTKYIGISKKWAKEAIS